MTTAFGKLLAETIGINPGVLGDKALARAVRERMSVCKLEDEEQYLAKLRSSSQEMEALIETVVIPETSFFRDKGPFAALGEHVRTEWMAARRTVPLRVLSAPCSSGEEPYSIAITLMETGLKPGEYEIDALDVSRALLHKAERATYTQYSFRGVSTLLRDRYFESVGNEFVLKDEARRGVRFICGNLLCRHVLAGRLPYDVVFCRNLLIYLGAEARARVTDVIERLVARNGLLFVGHAETACFLTARFAPLNPRGAFHFRKVETVAAASPGSVTAAPSLKAPVLPLAKAASRRTEPAPRETPESGNSVNAARRLADGGQLSEAAGMCERLLRENGANADAYCLLGVVQHGMENFQRAEECLDRALYLDDQCYDAVVHLALIKERKGDSAGAEVLRRRANRIQQQARTP